MTTNVWNVNEPLSVYSPWKRRLKSFLVKGLYRRLILIALRSVGETKLFLKTDLWVECIGIDQLEGVDRRIEVCGLDISGEICQAAKPAMLGRHVINASIVNLPFRSTIFDVLVDISTTDHVPHKEASHVFSEYSRVLKPEGVLVICLDSKVSLLWEMYRKLFLKYPVHSWMPSQIRESILTNGFKLVKGYFGNSFVDSLIPQVELIQGTIYNAIFSVISQYYIVIARKLKI